jgi:hypothetical protein
MFPDKVDVHAHFIPEEYREALIAAGQDRPDGIPALPQWSEELALAAMDELGIRLAILSISSPGVHIGTAPGSGRLFDTLKLWAWQLAPSWLPRCRGRWPDSGKQGRAPSLCGPSVPE